MAKFIFSTQYELALQSIEDHIFSSTEDLKFVEEFLDEHDHALKFIELNPETPAIHPKTGDQSWPLSEGRYRLFFRVHKGPPVKIFMVDIIDNKKANLELYPEHKLPTYTED